MVTAAIICAAAGLLLLAVSAGWLAGAFPAARDAGSGEWRERTADLAADFRDWLRLGR